MESKNNNLFILSKSGSPLSTFITLSISFATYHQDDTISSKMFFFLVESLLLLETDIDSESLNQSKVYLVIFECNPKVDTINSKKLKFISMYIFKKLFLFPDLRKVPSQKFLKNQATRRTKKRQRKKVCSEKY